MPRPETDDGSLLLISIPLAHGEEGASGEPPVFAGPEREEQHAPSTPGVRVTTCALCSAHHARRCGRRRSVTQRACWRRPNWPISRRSGERAHDDRRARSKCARGGAEARLLATTTRGGAPQRRSPPPSRTRASGVGLRRARWDVRGMGSWAAMRGTDVALLALR